jgi:hypothetical protein
VSGADGALLELPAGAEDAPERAAARLADAPPMGEPRAAAGDDDR